MTREELLRIEGAEPEGNRPCVRIILHDKMRLQVNERYGGIFAEPGDYGSSVYLGRAATAADVVRVVEALRGLGR